MSGGPTGVNVAPLGLAMSAVNPPGAAGSGSGAEGSAGAAGSGSAAAGSAAVGSEEIPSPFPRPAPSAGGFTGAGSLGEALALDIAPAGGSGGPGGQ